MAMKKHSGAAPAAPAEDITEPAEILSAEIRRLMAAAEAGVQKNAAGRWTAFGKGVRCKLGGHEGKARCRALARVLSDHLKPMSPEERARFIEDFNREQL